ncbi:hypothetical protein F9L33_12475 [Amylibacter sp. SFDW26]|uniref:hypothetical protein n=1 Tax=Amylibacter sp. SFDW26 TaxID=2652722 RepID=UPI001261B496|nr:hypothetical protein [Amylibacter sp. SFDW26]KAB7613407.1 hypothetical protein F9L33_12475 [Amylibacter sp. SFDW26]
MKYRHKVQMAAVAVAMAITAPASAGILKTHTGQKIIFAAQGGTNYHAKRHHGVTHFVFKKKRHNRHAYKRSHRSFKHSRGHFRHNTFKRRFRH